MSDLNVGVGPECGDGAKPPGLPGSGLLLTMRRGFGGGMNVGGSGGANELVELSVDTIGLFQSFDLLL